MKSWGIADIKCRVNEKIRKYILFEAKSIKGIKTEIFLTLM